MAFHRRRRDWVVGLTGAAAYALCGFAATGGVDRWERRIFAGLNQGDDEASGWLRVPRQLGVGPALPVLGAVALAGRRPRLALAALLALPVEKGLEVGVKYLAKRRRPAQLPMASRLRGDAPESGWSYPSGHAGVAVAIVVLVTPYVAPTVGVVVGAAAVVTGGARVYQGAHHPLDAVGGAGLGLAVGSALNLLLGVPVRD